MLNESGPAGGNEGREITVKGDKHEVRIRRIGLRPLPKRDLMRWIRKRLIGPPASGGAVIDFDVHRAPVSAAAGKIDAESPALQHGPAKPAYERSRKRQLRGQVMLGMQCRIECFVWNEGHNIGYTKTGWIYTPEDITRPFFGVTQGAMKKSPAPPLDDVTALILELTVKRIATQTDTLCQIAAENLRTLADIRETLRNGRR